MPQRLIAQDGFTPHWREDLTNEQYHADKTAVSSSQLRLLEKSAKTWKAHFDGVIPHKETKAKDFGTLAHKLILEGPEFLSNYAVMPYYGPYTTKDARQKRDDWILKNESKIKVTQEEFEHLKGMLASVMAHKDAKMLLKSGATEVSGYYVDPVTKIRCRIRPDFFSTDLMTLIDLKTGRDASEAEFAKSIWNYRYDFQMAMYAEGIRHLTGDKVAYPAYIVVEKEPPYECAVYVCDESLMARGLQDYHKALDRLRRAIDTGTWPGIQTGLTNISLPHWA